MSPEISRRQALASLGALAGGAILAAEAEGPLRLATFAAEVTPPLQHPLLGGLSPPAERIVDPLQARGVVLLGTGKPLVFAAVDWCEIRNDAYARWRTRLAEAVGTTARRVLLTSVHQHDAPLADTRAQTLLTKAGMPGAMCDPAFHEETVKRVAAAARQGLETAQVVTHVGRGQAKVDRIASNRRVELPDGRVNFSRYSHTRNAAVRDLSEGEIDPWLKTLSFWRQNRPLAALSFYATHPMSYYRTGGVSADFVGIARDRRQRDDAGVFQIYASGCSGDVTAGKYNDGTEDSRQKFAARLYDAMAAAWRDTRRERLARIGFRSVPLKLRPRTDGEYQPDALRRRLADENAPPRGRILAAMGLSWQQAYAAGRRIDVPAIDLGAAQLLLLPGETFVGYQLAAQRMRADSYVAVAGYGECAPGYIPTDRAREEGFAEEHGWCWVPPGVEPAMTAAIRRALAPA